MKNLYLKLEQLLEDFVAGFLSELLNSGTIEAQTELSGEMQERYFGYLKHFHDLQNDIEHSAPVNKEEALLRSRALTVLKSSSQNIFNTFTLEG